MKRMIVVALAVLGVCMAATASVSAHEFHASKTGKLLGLSTSSWVFTLKTGGGAVTCKHVTTTGTITALLALHQLVNVFYSGCEAFLSPMEIGTAKYLLSADGLAAIENTIVIKVGGVGNCTITLKPQDLGTVKFKTDSSNSAALIEESAVAGIVSTGSGGECGTNNTGGTYTGNNLIFEDGGSLSWT